MKVDELPPPRARQLGVLAALGVFGQVVFFLAVALLPLFQPGYSSFDDPLSALLIGPYGFLLTGAVFVTGLGSLALAIGIRKTTRGTRGSLLGSALIGLRGIGIAIAGIVLTDPEGNPTETGLHLHALSAGVSLSAALLGILVLSRVFAREARWSAFYPVSLALGFAAVVGLIDLAAIWVGLHDFREVVGPSVLSSFSGLGLMQRMFVGPLEVWMLLTAARLRSIAKDGDSHHDFLSNRVS